HSSAPTSIAVKGNFVSSPAETALTLPELSEVQRHDPFRFPDDFQKPAPAEVAQVVAEQAREVQQQRQERQAAMEALAREGVAAIVQTPRGKAATIGKRIVREGDVIDGFRVVSIDRNGIVLEDATPPAD